ncbi:MAG: ferric reductase-like transmembrane domain-containing protein, partial [Acidimicrobiales bacterium]
DTESFSCSGVAGCAGTIVTDLPLRLLGRASDYAAIAALCIRVGGSSRFAHSQDSGSPAKVVCMHSKLIWYTARASGLVTWGLLAASVLWGLALSSRLLRRRLHQAWLLDLHRFLAGAAVVFLAIHVTSIVLDTYVHFGIIEVLVPFTGTWHPDAVAWGVAGLYLLLALQVTSIFRARLPKKIWRSTHYLSFPLFAVATVHGLTAGTDRHTFAMQAGFIGVAALITLLTAFRVVVSNRRIPVATHAPRALERNAA